MVINKERHIFISNEKVGFIIGFIAIIIALYPFKSILDNINVDVVVGTFSLTKLIMVFVILLFISLYAYAINYIRYDFQIIRIKTLKYIELVAHILYSIAIILYPLLVLIFWIFSYFFKLIYFLHQQTMNKLQQYFFVIFSAITIIGLIIIKTMEWIDEEKTNIEQSKEKEMESTYKAKEAYKKGAYDSVIINIYHSLISLINARLIKEYRLDISRVSFQDALNLMHKNKLISKEEIELIKHIRKLRNEIVHGELKTKLSLPELKLILSKVENILKNLNYKAKITSP